MRAIELYRTELEASRNEFVHSHPRPFVVYARDPSRDSAPVDSRMLTMDRFVVEGQRQQSLKESIVATELTPRDPSEAMVTVGVAETCDIVINDASLSKQHAWFAVNGQGYWQIWDNDSVAGTQVNGELLKPGFPRALQSGDVIALGYVELTFLTPEAFYSLVKHLLR